MSRTPVRLDRRGIIHDGRMAGRGVNIVLDGVRVWSCTLPSGQRQDWPDALRELLAGVAHGQVTDAVTEDVLWEGDVRWSKAGSPDLYDANGRALRVDKWGRMKPSFETGRDIRPMVARAAATVLSLLCENGFDAFIVGGTLLGAVRDGEILPHDDDADVAYLSAHSDPADLILENHRVHRLLLENGFPVVRHSWAHLQVLSDQEGAEYYVDIFTAFYKSGHFHEPIHVRTPGLKDSIVPVTTQRLHGVELMAPRDPESWLVACYGPSWRIPEPGFVFDTPWSTQRRFHAWFGSYYLGINNWQRRYSVGGSPHESDIIRGHVIPGTDAVIDLGSGDGEDLDAYRAAGISVTGSEVVASAKSTTKGATLVNLVDYMAAFKFLRTSLAGTANAVVAANHLLACQDPRGRRTLLELFHFALRRGARVIAADYEQLGRYRLDQPRTWHLEWSTRLEEAQQVALECRLLERAQFTDEDDMKRDVVVVEYVLAGEETP